MIRKTIRKINRRKLMKFNHNNCCPECGSELKWNNKEKTYSCVNNDCNFKCNENGSKIFDTADCVDIDESYSSFEESEFLNDYQNIFNL